MSAATKSTGLMGRIRAKLRESASIRQLEALSDRQLRDIGVSRSEIHSMVREGARNRAYA